MVCSACGCNQEGAASFCRQCGVRLGYVAQPFYPVADPQRRRVQKHLQPLGISWMLYGTYRLFAGLLAGLAFHLFARQTFSDVPPFVTELASAILPGVLTLLAITSVLAIVTGYGLVKRRAWARIPAMVLAVLALLKLPFGTALGVYTLWVLAPRVAGEEFQAIAQPA